VKKLLVAAALAALAVAAPADAQQPVTIKLGTLAPQGSTWHDLLKEMGQRWEQVSGGKVKLRIYAGGAQGSEGDMVRKMGIGQLQAAAISNVGLHDVIPEPQVFSVPFLLADEKQLECVFEKVRPRIEDALAKRNLVALHWSRIGAIHLFCAQPRRTPADMKTAKIWTWEGDPGTVQAYRVAGFQPVVLSANDIYPSLQTGMIDCVPNVPLYVLTARMFDKARHMNDVPWAYMMGATVVRQDAWEKIAADVRPKLLAIAKELGEKVDEEVRRLNADAVTAMQKQGLSVEKTDAASWRTQMEKSWPVVRGEVVPAAFFDQVRSARDGCPAGK
jgi:TRAP-type C4-dicarboxylate transport system substrate-binding protein